MRSSEIVHLTHEGRLALIKHEAGAKLQLVIPHGETLPEARPTTHWTKGGTGVTNFDPKQYALYQLTIERLGSPDYYILREPMADSHPDGGFSLHCLMDRANFDTSAFMRILNDLEKGIEP